MKKRTYLGKGKQGKMKQQVKHQGCHSKERKKTNGNKMRKRDLKEMRKESGGVEQHEVQGKSEYV